MCMYVLLLSGGSVFGMRSGGYGSKRVQRSKPVKMASPVNDKHSELCIETFCGKCIGLSDGEQAIKSVYTTGLVGCAAVAVYVIHQSGEQSALLTHYSHARDDKHFETLSAELQKIKNSGVIASAHLVTLTAGQESKKGFVADPAREPFLKSIVTLVANELSVEDMPVTHAWYNKQRNSKKPETLYDFELVLYPDKNKSCYYEKGSGHIQRFFNDKVDNVQEGKER